MLRGETYMHDFIGRVLIPERKGASFEHLLALAKQYPTIHEKIGIIALAGKCFTESEGQTPEEKAIPMYPVLGKRTAPKGKLHKVISLAAEVLGGKTGLENKDYAGLIIVSEEKI